MNFLKGGGHANAEGPEEMKSFFAPKVRKNENQSAK